MAIERALVPGVATCYREVDEMQEVPENYRLHQNATVERNINSAELIEVPAKVADPNETIRIQEELLLVPLGCVLAIWALIYLTPFAFWKALRYRIRRVEPSHKIPCSKCQYFQNSPYLQCAVHPSKVLKTEAINCPDYCHNSEKNFP